MIKTIARKILKIIRKREKTLRYFVHNSSQDDDPLLKAGNPTNNCCCLYHVPRIITHGVCAEFSTPFKRQVQSQLLIFLQMLSEMATWGKQSSRRSCRNNDPVFSRIVGFKEVY